MTKSLSKLVGPATSLLIGAYIAVEAPATASAHKNIARPLVQLAVAGPTASPAAPKIDRHTVARPAAHATAPKQLVVSPTPKPITPAAPRTNITVQRSSGPGGNEGTVGIEHRF